MPTPTEWLKLSHGRDKNRLPAMVYTIIANL